MIRLTIPARENSERYPSDVDHIVKVCNQAGYDIDRHAAVWAWEAESEMYAAGWLGLPDDDSELLRTILRRLTENT